MPSATECTLPEQEKYLFRNQSGNLLLGLTLFGLACAYLVPVVVIYRRWSTPDIKPRSPVMILFLISFLFLDSSGNTILFSVDPQIQP